MRAKGGRQFFFAKEAFQTHSTFLFHSKCQISQLRGVLYRQEQKTKKL